MFQTNSKSQTRLPDQQYIEDSEYQVQPAVVVSALPSHDPHIFQNFISQYNYYLSSPTHNKDDNTQMQYKKCSFPLNSHYSHSQSPNQPIRAQRDSNSFSNKNKPYFGQEAQQKLHERAQVTQNQMGPSSFNDFFSAAANVSQFHKNFQQNIRQCISQTDKREQQQTSQEKQDLTKGRSEQRNYYQDLDSLCHEIKMQSHNPELGQEEAQDEDREKARSILEASNCRERYRQQVSDGQNKQNKISQKEQPLFKQMVRQQYQRITEQSSRQESQKSFSKVSDKKSEQAYKSRHEPQRKAFKSQNAKECNQKKSSNLDAKAEEILKRARERQAKQAEIQKQQNVTKAKQIQTRQKLPQVRNPDQKQDFKYKLKQIQKQQLQDQLNQFYNNKKDQVQQEKPINTRQNKLENHLQPVLQSDDQQIKSSIKQDDIQEPTKDEIKEFRKTEIQTNTQSQSPPFFPSLQLSDYRQNSKVRLHNRLFQPVKQAKLNQQNPHRLDNKTQNKKGIKEQERQFDRTFSPKVRSSNQIQQIIDLNQLRSDEKYSHKELKQPYELQIKNQIRENKRYQVIEADCSPLKTQIQQETLETNFIRHNLPYSSINKKQCTFHQYQLQPHQDTRNLFPKSQSTTNIDSWNYQPHLFPLNTERNQQSSQNKSYLQKSEEFLIQRRTSRSPGHSTYQIKDLLVKPSSIQHKIPQGKRSDIILKSTSEAVGPGSYNLPNSTFNYQKQRSYRAKSPQHDLQRLKLESLLRSHSLTNKQLNSERRQSRQVIDSKPDYSIKQLKEELVQRRIKNQREEDLRRQLSENYREVYSGQKLIQQKEPEEEEFKETFTLSPLGQFQTFREQRNNHFGKVTDQQRSSLINKYNTPRKKNISSLQGQTRESQNQGQNQNDGSKTRPISLDKNIHINPKQIQKLSHYNSTFKLPTSREQNQFQDPITNLRSSSLKQVPSQMQPVFSKRVQDPDLKYKRLKLVDQYQKPIRKLIESKEQSPFIREFSQSHYSEDIYEIDPRDSLPTLKYFTNTEQEISNVNLDRQLDNQETLNQDEEEDQAVVSINLDKSDSNSDQDVIEIKKQIQKQMKQLCKEQEQLTKRYPKTSNRQTQFFKNLSTDLEAINEHPEGEEAVLQGDQKGRNNSTDQEIEKIMENSELSKDQDLKQLYKNYLKAKTQFKLYERTLKNFLKEESQLEISQSPKRIKKDQRNTSRSSSRQSQKQIKTQKQNELKTHCPKWKNKEEKQQSDNDILALYQQNNLLIVESQTTSQPKKSWSTLNLQKLKQNQKQKIIQKVESLIHHKETVSDRLYDKNYKGRRRDLKSKTIQNTSRKVEEEEEIMVEEPMAELQRIKMEISIENLMPEQDSQLKDGHTIIINNGVSSLIEQESSFSNQALKKCKFYSLGKNGENHDQECSVCAKKWQSNEQNSSNQDQTNLHNISDQITPINKTNWSRGYGNSFKQGFTQQSEIIEIQGHLDELRYANEMDKVNQQQNREVIYQNIIKEMEEIDCSEVIKESDRLKEIEKEKQKKQKEIQNKSIKREKELESNFGRLFDILKVKEESQVKEDKIESQEDEQVQIPVMKLEIQQESIQVKKEPKNIKVSEFGIE